MQFYCKHCTEEINGVTNYKHSNKIHKGIIYGCGYGYAIDNINLSFKLKRIKYYHEVDTNKPINIIGNIPVSMISIIDEINIKRRANNYNL